MNQRYRETMEIVQKAGFELDKDMDASLWEGIEKGFFQKRGIGVRMA